MKLLNEGVGARKAGVAGGGERRKEMKRRGIK